MAIFGMGGVGKSELAWHYADRQAKAGTYPGGVCWLRAREDVGLQIILFARTHLDLTPPDDLELVDRVKWCWQRWGDGATLLVLDDVQEYAKIRSLLPPQDSRFKVLMTTRSRFGSPVKPFEIKVLSEAKASALLRAIATQNGEGKDLRFLQEIGGLERQVCHWLGYLPLGLELVGRYLNKRKDVSIAQLWERLQDKKLFAKALLAAEPEMTASLGVAAAFELSWQDLDLKSQRLAVWLSLFALAEIPWRLVEACWPEEEPEDLADLRDEKLVGLSLLTRADVGMYELHQLLREFFRTKLRESERQPMKTALATVLVAVAKDIPQDPTLDVIGAVTAAIPHLQEVADELSKLESKADLFLEDEDDLAWIFIGISRFYNGQGLYAAAEPWYKDCLAVVRSLLGENHPHVATSLNNLAALYDSQGRYEAAEPLYLQALQLTRSLLGESHPDVATSLNNLAVTLSVSRTLRGGRTPLPASFAITAIALGRKPSRCGNQPQQFGRTL